MNLNFFAIKSAVRCFRAKVGLDWVPCHSVKLLSLFSLRRVRRRESPVMVSGYHHCVLLSSSPFFCMTHNDDVSGVLNITEMALSLFLWRVWQVPAREGECGRQPPTSPETHQRLLLLLLFLLARPGPGLQETGEVTWPPLHAVSLSSTGAGYRTDWLDWRMSIITPALQKDVSWWHRSTYHRKCHC